MSFCLSLSENSGAPVLSDFISQAQKPTFPLANLNSTSTAMAHSADSAESAPKPQGAPVVFLDRVSSAPTMLLVSTSQVITQKLAASEDLGTTTQTQVVLDPPTSPGWAPKQAPSPDSSTIDEHEMLQEKVEHLLFT